jgi:hypothetical protein
LTTFCARITNGSADAARPAAVLDQLGHQQPVGADRAEALGLGQDGQHQARVVGLAVVEQVARRGLARRQRGQALDDLVGVDDPVAVRRPVRRVPVAAPTAPRHRHHVVQVEPHAHHAVGARAVEGGDDQRQRLDQVRREPDHDLALDQRLADEAEVEVLQVAQAAVDELGGPR